MKKWRCTRCGYIHEGDSPPDVCPVCGAPKELFEPYEEKTAATTGVTGEAADILVVGSGAAAFSAAVTARSRGASVIMLEKAAQTGGTTARSGGGYWVPGNRWQKAAGYEDDPEKCVAYMARYSYPTLYNPAAPRLGLPEREYSLLQAYVENARKMAEHFDDIGALKSMVEINWTGKPQVDYMDHLPENGGIRGRTIYPKTTEGKLGYGDELIRQLEGWAKANGVKIITSCQVTGIQQNEEGVVTGLACKTAAGSTVFTARKGVIFGSGGYSHNPQLMLQWQRGPHYGGCAVPTNTGDFIRMAGGLGAMLANTAGAFRAQSMIETALQNPGGSSNVFYLIGDSMLLVNKYGRRVVDEKRNYTDRTMLHFVWDPVKAEWSNLLTFMLFDARAATLWQGFPPFPVSGQNAPHLIKADSLEALAPLLEKRLEKLAPHTGGFGLDAAFTENLRATVERFNTFAQKGKDEDFARGENAYDQEWTTFPPTVPGAEWPPKNSKNPALYPLAEKGPYYALILAAGTLDTNGGPATDAHARVLNWEGQPIKGLYGAGNCIASPTANAYWGAGSTIGPAMAFGYMAALHATGG